MSSEFEFQNGIPVPVHKPLWIRRIRLWDKTISLSALPDGNFYIPVESICKMFNLSLEDELKRIRSSGGYFFPESTLIRMPVANEQETQPVICLSLSVLPLFLSTVSLATIPDEVSRNTLRYFQVHAHGALAEHFGVGSLFELVEKTHGMEEMIFQNQQDKDQKDPDPF